MSHSDPPATYSAANRLLVAASGTGGHVFPAFAIADQLTDWEIEWLGVPDRMEVQLVQDRYPLHTVTMSGIQGPRAIAWIRSLSQLAGAVARIRQILVQGQFKGVLTTGGYIAAPAILAARSVGLPVILHESNAIPGKVTRWLGRWCTTVALGSAAAEVYLKGTRTQVVGTPVRAEFWDPAVTTAVEPKFESLTIPDGVPLIAVVGGSQGARGLNQIVVTAAKAWLEAGAWIIHLTGQVDAERVEALAPSDPHYLRIPFWADMAGLLRRADFAVCRSGAATLAELVASETPAILIPYPYAAEDHQYSNGSPLVELGVAAMFRESDQAAAQVESLGLEWIRHPERLAAVRPKLQSLGSREAADRMAQLINLELLG